MRAIGDREDVVRPDPRREGRQDLFRHQATGGDLTPDEPRRDAVRRRIREVREAAVPVAILKEDSTRRRDVENEGVTMPTVAR